MREVLQLNIHADGETTLGDDTAEPESPELVE